MAACSVEDQGIIIMQATRSDSFRTTTTFSTPFRTFFTRLFARRSQAPRGGVTEPSALEDLSRLAAGEDLPPMRIAHRE